MTKIYLAQTKKSDDNQNLTKVINFMKHDNLTKICDVINSDNLTETHNLTKIDNQLKIIP